MQPSIPLGSLVLTQKQSEYQEGDVITFQNTGDTKYLITHRLKNIEELENGKLFITKGDANEDADSERVDPGSVVGKVIWALPLIGFVVSFARTQTGLIALVVIPATIIIYSEVLAIKKELGKLKVNLKKKPKTSRFFLPKLLGLMLLFSLTFIGKSRSAYTDSETVNSNFAAAECFGECGEGGFRVQGQESEQGIVLDFYKRPGLLEVGFEITGVVDYDSLEYEVTYVKNPDIDELIPGTKDNSVHSATITEEWIPLGFCSSGGCTYDDVVGDVHLTVNLLQGTTVVYTFNSSLTP
jgi:signal peptidase I